MHTNYQNLRIWKKSFALTLDVYKILAMLPMCESNNIIDQMRRAVTSLPLNIAEGASSKTTKMFINHLHYAYASAQELEVLLMLCIKLDYIPENNFSRAHVELDSLKSALYNFTTNLERKSSQERLSFLKKCK